MASPAAGADIIAVLRFRRKQVLDSFQTQREISGNSFHPEIGHNFIFLHRRKYFIWFRKFCIIKVTPIGDTFSMKITKRFRFLWMMYYEDILFCYWYKYESRTLHEGQNDKRRLKKYNWSISLSDTVEISKAEKNSCNAFLRSDIIINSFYHIYVCSDVVLILLMVP